MRLRVDRKTNALVVTLDDGPEPERTLRAEGTIDVGMGGALLGVEVRESEELTELAEGFAGWGSAASIESGAAYVALMTGADRNARSAAIAVEVGLDERGHVTSLAIPRRGTGYEITYPSGNR